MLSKDTDEPAAVNLDDHRGMAAQVATDARRHLTGVQADQTALRQAQEELERFLFADKAASWLEAAERAEFLLKRFAATAEGRDPRYKRLVEAVLEDFKRLAAGGLPPR